MLPACSQHIFEQYYFKASEIPEVIKFIKETGRLQFVLQNEPSLYEGLGYLDQLFTDLQPPYLRGINLTAFGKESELRKNVDIFYDTFKGQFF